MWMAGNGALESRVLGHCVVTLVRCLMTYDPHRSVLQSASEKELIKMTNTARLIYTTASLGTIGRQSTIRAEV